jgi:hypothetical protein
MDRTRTRRPVAIAGFVVLALVLFLALRECGSRPMEGLGPIATPPREFAPRDPQTTPQMPRAAAPVVAESEPPTPVEPVTPRPATIPADLLVRVVERISGAPVPLARLMIRSDREAPAWDAAGTWLSADGEGVVRIAPSEQPRWALVHGDAVAVQSRPVQRAEGEGGFMVAVDAGVSLRGRLRTPSGGPAPNVPVRILAASTESVDPELRRIQLWTSTDGRPRWDARDLQRRVARFREGDPLVHFARTDADGGFRLVLGRAEEWIVRAHDPSGVLTLATTTLRPGDGREIEFDLTISDVCVIRVHVDPLAAVSEGERTLRLRREDGARALPFRFDPSCPLYTAPAVPFRVVLEGVNETVSDEVRPAVGETVDVRLAIDASAPADTVTIHDAEPTEQFRIVTLEHSGRIGGVRYELVRDPARTSLTLRIPRITAETRRIGIVAANTGRSVTLDPSRAPRPWECALGSTGGVVFRWANDARRGFTVTCQPPVLHGIAGFDEFWRLLDDGGTRGIARELVLYGIPEGTTRVRIDNGGLTVFDRDVTVTAGGLVAYELEPPAKR